MRFIQKNIVALLIVFLFVKISAGQGVINVSETEISSGGKVISAGIANITFNLGANNSTLLDKQGFRTIADITWLLVDPDSPLGFPMWSKHNYTNQITISIQTLNGHSITGGSITIKAELDGSSSSITSNPGASGFWSRTITLGSGPNTSVVNDQTASSVVDVSHIFSGITVGPNTTSNFNVTRTLVNTAEATSGYSFIQVSPQEGLKFYWSITLNHD